MNTFTAPLASTIPYGIKREVGEYIYSLDKFRPRFPLKWQGLRVVKDGQFLPASDVNIRKAFFSSLIHPLYAVCPESFAHGDSNNPRVLHWWRCDGVLILLEKFKPFGSQDYNYSATIEFNPNKHMASPVPSLFISTVKEWLGDFFVWRNTRCDFALDVPYPISDVRLLSRKTASSYEGTFYFGKRGNAGYTRVYDKRKHMLEVFKQDIGREVTRIEWEQHFSECTFDMPYRLGDLGKHEVLRFVPLDMWPAALRTYDPRTAKKIRDGLYELPFNTQYFDDMFHELLDHLGLDMADCYDHIDRKRRSQVQIQREMDLDEEYEKMVSMLRKLAQTEI